MHHQKVVLITGSTGGIGLGIAHSFAKSGYSIVLNGILSAAEAEPLRKELTQTYGTKVIYLPADISQAINCKILTDQTIEHFGRIDTLINNAGIQHVAPLEEFSEEKWQQIISINLSSCFCMIKYVLPFMRQQQFGRIINIASVHGLVASEFKSAYVAAKHGLIGLTKTVGLETAPENITCNAICPGWVLTPLVQKQIEERAEKKGVSVAEETVNLLSEKQPSKQFVTVEQIGQFALFLASDSAAQITGAALPIDGGWTAR